MQFVQALKVSLQLIGSSMLDLGLNPIIKDLISMNIIERIIFLDENKKGFIKDIYYLDKKNKEYLIKTEEI